MSTKWLVKAAAGLLGFALVVVAFGSETPPTENRGVKVGQTASIDLGAEIDRVQGRLLRLRVLTIDPGGIVGLHNHRDRPAVLYIVRGTLTDYPEGGGVKERHAGESWSEGKDVTHWAENKGSEPLVLVAVDVFKQGM